MTVSALFRYPIKSCRGSALTEATLDAQGIRYDRAFQVVYAENGAFVTQREFPQMACLVPTVQESEGTLLVEAPRLPTLTVPLFAAPEAEARTITVWSFTGEAADMGEEAASWFSQAMGFACRLVRTPENFARRVNPKYALPEDRIGFADGYPLLLTSTASLDDLNARLAVPIPMERFRPNVIVTGAQPAFVEETWSTVRIGDEATFRCAKPCARCAVTTIDQETGQKTGAEPLATLARYRRSAEGKVNFGQNLIHDTPGAVLRVGDEVVAQRVE